MKIYCLRSLFVQRLQAWEGRPCRRRGNAAESLIFSHTEVSNPPRPQINRQNQIKMENTNFYAVISNEAALTRYCVKRWNTHPYFVESFAHVQDAAGDVTIERREVKLEDGQYKKFWLLYLTREQRVNSLDFRLKLDENIRTGRANILQRI